MLQQHNQQPQDGYLSSSDDAGGGSESDAHTSGTAGEAAWGLQERTSGPVGGERRRSTRVKYRARRSNAPAAE
jgi:hypothetical protein